MPAAAGPAPGWSRPFVSWSARSSRRIEPGDGAAAPVAEALLAHDVHVLTRLEAVDDPRRERYTELLRRHQRLAGTGKCGARAGLGRRGAARPGVQWRCRVSLTSPHVLDLDGGAGNRVG